MSERKSILFISAPVGAGHIRAAQAVGAAIKAASPQVDTQFANIFDFIHPSISKIILAVYLRGIDYFPQTYGRLYGWANNSQLAKNAREFISGYLANHMRQYILAVRPQAIVCTHATPAGLVAHLCNTTDLNIPTFAVVTDFVIHRLWVYPEINHYFVAHEAMRDFLARYNVGPERSHAWGIPVDPRFTLPFDRPQIMHSLDLCPDRTTILLMGGGAGLLPMIEIIAACESSALPLQFIAVAGKNKILQHELMTLQPKLKHCQLRALGFVDNPHELMAVADFLISKPGGVTAAEALSLGLPLIIYRPIPGPETANCRYLLEHSAAQAVSSLAELCKVINKLVSHPEQLAELRRQAALLGKPTAAADIAKVILEVINRTEAEARA